jgi:AMMECR1 domain-containing protein
MTSYAKLARSAAEHYVKTGQVLAAPAYLAPELARQQACYVYIFANPGRRLRTLYGYALPRRPSLAEEIIANTLAAVKSVAGSLAVRRVELPSLTYTVAVLGALQRVGSEAHLDPRMFGLFIRSDRGKSAVVLPQRTGVETSQDQIATAIRESAINVREEAASMYRFPVSYYDEAK